MGILENFFGPPNIEKLKEKRDVKGLIKALSHKEWNIRRDAAKALGELNDRGKRRSQVVRMSLRVRLRLTRSPVNPFG